MTETSAARAALAPHPQDTVADVARSDPRRPAIVCENGDRTFAELDANVNRLARALRRRGLRPGDAIALVCANRPEFVEVLYAGFRAGLRVTPVNWHLTAEEIAYIVADCEAKAFVADVRFADRCSDAAGSLPGLGVRLAVGGPVDGFEDLPAATAAEDADPIPPCDAGTTMMYTSGTTGRPKGVYRRKPPPRRTTVFARVPMVGGTSVHLCTGPLYHAAPLVFSLTYPHAFGTSVVLMDGWSAEGTLRLVAEHRVTHTHMVPTMFHRLLQLPDEVRDRYDVSSLRCVVHGAAPCPVATKRAMIEWWGPVVYEYYAATEGAGTAIGPEEWLGKPGSVGRSPDGHVEIRDDDGRPVAPGVVGTVFLRAPDDHDVRFEYFKDPEKTGRSYADDRFTLGDMGYLDEDGYLFLTDRSADIIITGGVNVYPAEVDAVLITHPSVADACTIGVPDAEWGERVKAVVELRDGHEPSEALAAQIADWCRERLAHYKCPRSVDFVDELPRHPTGKLYRRLVRERYRTKGA